MSNKTQKKQKYALKKWIIDWRPWAVFVASATLIAHFFSPSWHYALATLALTSSAVIIALSWRQMKLPLFVFIAAAVVGLVPETFKTIADDFSDAVDLIRKEVPASPPPASPPATQPDAKTVAVGTEAAAHAAVTDGKAEGLVAETEQDVTPTKGGTTTASENSAAPTKPGSPIAWQFANPPWPSWVWAGLLSVCLLACMVLLDKLKSGLFNVRVDEVDEADKTERTHLISGLSRVNILPADPEISLRNNNTQDEHWNKIMTFIKEYVDSTNKNNILNITKEYIQLNDIFFETDKPKMAHTDELDLVRELFDNDTEFKFYSFAKKYTEGKVTDKSHTTDKNEIIFLKIIEKSKSARSFLGAVALRSMNWFQTLRAIRILPTKNIILIPSTKSSKQMDKFVELLHLTRPLIGDGERTIQVQGLIKNCIVDIATVPPVGPPKDDASIIDVDAVDYENVKAVETKMRTALSALRAAKVKDTQIAVDITAGQKSFSVAAAIHALQHAYAITYINNDGKLKAYDCRIAILSDT